MAGREREEKNPDGAVAQGPENRLLDLQSKMRHEIHWLYLKNGKGLERSH